MSSSSQAGGRNDFGWEWNIDQMIVNLVKKALNNKDRMSGETRDGLGLFSPEVHREISKEDVVVTIVPEIYTFWR